MKPKAVMSELEQLFAGRWSPGDLVLFQARHRLTLASHAPDVQKEMSQLTASASYIDAAYLERTYRSHFTKALESESTIAKNVSVFDTAFGILKDKLKDEERKELKDLIEKFRTKEIPKSKPIARFRKHIQKHQPEELKNQSYFMP